MKPHLEMLQSFAPWKSAINSSPFLIVVMLAGAPPFLTAALLAYFSNLSAGLAYYGTTPGPIYFGTDYVTQKNGVNWD